MKVQAIAILPLFSSVVKGGALVQSTPGDAQGRGDTLLSRRESFLLAGGREDGE